MAVSRGVTLAANSPGLIDGLLACSVRRLRRSQLAAFLTSMFGPLEPALLDQLDGHEAAIEPLGEWWEAEQARR